MVENPYIVLGISQNATQEEIKKAYHQKAKEYHPDLHPNDSSATRKMNEINEAYDMLSNPQKYENSNKKQTKSTYENTRYQQNPYQSSNRNDDRWDNFHFEDIFGFDFNRDSNTTGQEGFAAFGKIVISFLLLQFVFKIMQVLMFGILY